MGTFVRNVGEIDAHDRQSLEHVLGHCLGEDQQLVINIVNLESSAGIAAAAVALNTKGTSILPEWCNVYAGLSDDEIAEMEQTILQRAVLSRRSE
jgi:hypothetical protein